MLTALEVKKELPANSVPNSSPRAHAARFLLQFLLKPGTTGAVAPSSPALAQRMVEWLDFSSAQAIVEYGPGTGVFTQAVLARRARHCKFFAIELNPVFIEVLRPRFPGVPIHQDSVGNCRQICDREGIGQVDCIISGLPWASFPDALQKQLLDATMTVLKSGGQFVTFAYLHGLLFPPGQHFRKRLRGYFREISSSPIVWNNLPPAFVYRCRR